MGDRIITWAIHRELGRISCDGLDVYNWLLDKNQDIAEMFYIKMMDVIKKDKSINNIFPKK